MSAISGPDGPVGGVPRAWAPVGRAGRAGRAGFGRGGAAASPYAQALRLVRRDCPLGLEIQPFQPQGCMDLEVELEPALQALGADGGGLQQRRAMLSQLLHALHAQHGALLSALATAPAQRDWDRLRALRFTVCQGDIAVAAFVAAVQDQRLTVHVGDADVAVPIRAVAARLPPGSTMVELRGVPDDCARKGLTEAVLRTAGYGPAQGVVVVHERLGMVRGPLGDSLPMGRIDMVVAVVSTPPEDSNLLRLPAEVVVEGQRMCIQVSSRLSPPALRLAPAPPASPVGPAQRATVLDRVGAAHGLTSQARQAGPQPVAAAVVQSARLPGDRAGLGFARGPHPPPPPPPPLPPVPRTAVSLPDLTMLDAPPPLETPGDEPVFGVALEYLQEAAADLSHEEQQRAVLAMRDHHPNEYQACLGASRVGDLPRALQVVLHCQARALFGSRAGVPPSVAAAWDDGDGEEGGESGHQTLGEASLADACAVSVGETDLGGLTPAVEQGPPRGHSGHRIAEQPRRASSRVRAPVGQFWVVQQPAPAHAPTTNPQGKAASARTGGAGAGRGRRHQ